MRSACTGHTRIWATLDPFVEAGPVLGRKVANLRFLEALLEQDPFDAYHFFLAGQDQVRHQESWLADNFPRLWERGACVVGLRESLPARMADTNFFCFHLSDFLTNFSSLTRLRNACSGRIFPVTGTTHSLSYQRFMPSFLEHLWEGVSPRDAIIATSHSARLVIEEAFAALREGYGLGERFFAPGLAHIPLGVQGADETAARPEETHVGHGQAISAGRLRMRARLGVDKEVLLLSLSRISPSSKMDVLPVLAALERAGGLGLEAHEYLLVLAGWASEGDPLPDTLARYAAARDIRLLPFVRPTDAECRDLYAAADVFLSPSDNVQETFGLTVAEAGAAGLPVIASDFNGYRDIVAHEKTGILIPTLGFGESAETNALAGVWMDNQYHLRLAQQVVVDVPALARALHNLIRSPDKRREMGEAARARIARNFSWPGIIRRHVRLWEDLAAAPIDPARREALRRAVHPLQMPFDRLFRGHFSRVLDRKNACALLVQRTRAGDALYRGALPPLRYAGMEHMLDEDAIRRVLLAARRPATLETLVAAALSGATLVPLAETARERAMGTVLWALKQDYLELVAGDEASPARA